MELTQLAQFKTIAECENISKAAEKLYVSQPGLSKAIKNMEKELNINLFDRTKNSIVLNGAGRIALSYINSIFDEIEKMKSALEDYAGSNKTLHFCSSNTPCIRYVLPMFSKACLDIEMSSQIIPQGEIEKLLLNKSVDIAISPEPIINENIYHMPICEDRFAMIVPLAHPLAQKEQLKLNDLKNQKLIRHVNADYYSLYFDELLKKNKVHVEATFQSDILVIMEIIKTTNEYLSLTSLLGKSYFDTRANNRIIPIAGKAAVLTYYISYHRDNKRCEPFLDWIRSNYKDIMI